MNINFSLTVSGHFIPSAMKPLPTSGVRKTMFFEYEPLALILFALKYGKKEDETIFSALKVPDGEGRRAMPAFASSERLNL
mgnify:CR=1 FL=1